MRLTTWVVFAASIALGGCASTHQLDNDVSTFSQWPAGRKPATYVFERLPSQQARPEQQQQLEDAARAALEAAGFAAAPEGQDADVVIQVGARTSATERELYDDPFWWRGGLYTGWRRSRFTTGLGVHYTAPIYEREVALLIRDRKTTQVLYEARASNSASSAASTAVLSAMFEAAMKDFPHVGVNPRRITVTVAQ